MDHRGRLNWKHFRRNVLAVFRVLPYFCSYYLRRVGQRNFTYSLSQTLYVNLSIHTAPANRSFSTFQFWNYAEICILSHFLRLDTFPFGLAHPLGSDLITRPSLISLPKKRNRRAILHLFYSCEQTSVCSRGTISVRFRFIGLRPPQ
jgi:hypothetical protein